MGEVLALTIGYEPHAQVSWKKAIVWIIEQVAEVVEEYPERYIHSPSWTIRMPSIVRLLQPIPRKLIVKFSRNGIFDRDLGKCQYCGCKVSLDRFTFDHVIPRTQGGTTSWTNVVTSCVPCNQKKGGRIPEKAGMRLLVKPVRPKFVWNRKENHISIDEKTPESWRAFLDGVRSTIYWDSELDSE